MTDFAKGPLTGSILAAERMLANCPAFQTRVSETTAVGALTHIRLFDWEDDPASIQAARPFAALWMADDFMVKEMAGGNAIAVECTGGIVLLLTDQDNHTDDRRESGLDFAGWIDEIILWLKNNTNGNDGNDGQYLSIREIRFLRGPSHSPTKDEAVEGSYWHCALLIQYHGGG